MQRPKTLAESGWRESMVELVALYIAITIGATHLFAMHWLVAMLVAPFLMLALLGGIMAFVQVLWLVVVSLERVGTSLGLRKSPLA
jgi:hypothetical protein